MIRFLLRFIGLCVLALAFFFVVYDGGTSIVNQQLKYTNVADAWKLVDQTSLPLVQTWVKQHAAWASQYVQVLLGLPTSIMLAVAAMLLMMLGRKKRPLIGYAR